MDKALEIALSFFKSEEQMCQLGYDNYCQESGSWLGVAVGALTVAGTSIACTLYCMRQKQANQAQDEAPRQIGGQPAERWATLAVDARAAGGQSNLKKVQ